MPYDHKGSLTGRCNIAIRSASHPVSARSKSGVNHENKSG
jgi:hypothetical protein